MQKPKSVALMCSMIFSLLGVVFIITGALAKMGLVQTWSSVSDDPNTLFLIDGFVLLTAGCLLYLFAWYKNKIQKGLLNNGVAVKGTVIEINRLYSVHFGTRQQYPYVIRFSYQYNGIDYKGKSRLFWEMPNVNEHDFIEVFVDDRKPKRCAVAEKI